MALKIRLARGGSKKRPYYRIVVADSRMPRDGRYVEHVGAYNPLLAKDDENRVKLDVDRIKHWMSVGAKPTDRVHRFLDAAGLLKREAKNNPKKGEPSKKTLERIEEKKQKLEDAKQAEEDAKQAAKEAEAAAKDAPKEEAPAEAEAPKEDAPKEAEAAKDAEAPKEEAKAE